jgi:hypothetical protein
VWLRFDDIGEFSSLELIVTLAFSSFEVNPDPYLLFPSELIIPRVAKFGASPTVTGLSFFQYQFDVCFVGCIHEKDMAVHGVIG